MDHHLTSAGPVHAPAWGPSATQPTAMDATTYGLSNSYGTNWPGQDPSTGRGDMNRQMFANTSSDSINQLAHGDTSVSPSSYSSLLGGSRINLTNTVIRETDELADPQVASLSHQFSRVVSTDDTSRAHAGSMPHVASTGRLSEKRSSIDEQDVFGALGGLEIGGASTSGASTLPAAAAAPGAMGAAMGAPTPSAPGASAPPPGMGRLGDIPLGQLSRTLFVRNVEPTVTDDELYAVFERVGEIQTLFTAYKQHNFVVIAYYDIRAACLAVSQYHGRALARRSLDIKFAPDSETAALEASILAILADHSIGSTELQQVFEQFGEVRSLKDVPDKPGHKVVEFYDVRHASAALQSLNNVDMGKQLVVVQLATPNPAAQRESWAAAALAHSPADTSSSAMQRVLSDQALAGDGMGGGGSTAHMGALLGQQQQQQQQMTSQNAMMQQPGSAAMLGSASAADLTSHLLSSASSTTNLYQHHSSMLSGSSTNLVNHPVNAQALLGAGVGSTNSLAMGGAGGTDARLLSEALLMRRPGVSMSTGDLASLQGAAGLMGAGELRGIASTGNLWAGQHGMQGGLSGGASVPWTGSVPDLQMAAQQAGLAPWQLQEAAAQLRNQQALLGMQQSASVDNLLAMQNLPQAALLLQAMNNMNAQNALAQSLRAGKQHQLRPKDRREEGALGGPGGRLSRRNLDPVAEAERKAQQEKLYALDLDKIMAGADKRTTLMIKNIPNKYTQKMLLSTIDELFLGTYDFFYLPIDFKNKCNVGYAFINLIKPEYIVPLVEKFNHKKWEKFNSEKVCNISYARIQGKLALVAHFQNSSLLHEDKRCRPILFHTEGPMAGQPEAFPTKPTPARGMGGRTSSRGSLGGSYNNLQALGGGKQGDLW